MVIVAAFLLVAVALGIMLLLVIVLGAIFQLGTRAVLSDDWVGSKYPVAGTAHSRAAVTEERSYRRMVSPKNSVSIKSFGER